jgi:two-component system chemotaxis response regulator CheB
MEGIRVLCVDDSLFIRSFLSKILSTDPDIIEIKTANDGPAAIALLPTWQPDIITLDVEMPRMNGLDMLKIVKEKWDIPVLMVSSLTRKGADITIKALELGAVDWIQKPENSFDTKVYEQLAQDLIYKIKVVTQQTGPRRLASQLDPLAGSYMEATDRDHITNDHFKRLVVESKWTPKGTTKLGFYLVAVGISTGGPSALNQMIPKLNKDMNAAMIIVQHMPATFTKVLAERLNTLSNVTVKEAADGDIITKGFVYIVPGDKHVRLIEVSATTLKIKLDQYAKIGGFRPSAEPLFYFAAETCKEKSIGVIMTGMGSDGSDNIAMIRKYSGKTIAQDEATSVIFGMPKMAIQKGNIDFVLPLDKIVDKINDFIIR